MNKYVYHVTPKKNLASILEHGLQALQPEDDGDMAVSFFKTIKDAEEQSSLWLAKKYNYQKLLLLTVDISGLALTETFPFELITTNILSVDAKRIVQITSFISFNAKINLKR